MIYLITVPLQLSGLFWCLTSLHNSLLSETFSSLGDSALVLDCFPSYLFDLSLSTLLFECSQKVTKFLSFSLFLGHLILNSDFNDQIMSQAQSSTPPPCFLKSFDAFALTKNEIRCFAKANEDPRELTAGGLYVSFLTLMSFPHHSRDRNSGTCVSEHIKLSPTLGHLHKLFISV